MKTKPSLILPTAIIASFALQLSNSQATPKPEVLRGWISDEQCAKGRANSGTFTPTNLDCARECVSKGKKLVLIDPEGKRVLVIANPATASDHIGDYVEIQGEVNVNSGSLQVDSLKFLEKTKPMCGVPAKTKPAKK